MTFFNKKEEVMKVELTPYGRYLLSIGKLKPHSYRFFDDNIIYDSASGGFEEKQNEANYRIKETTPNLKGNPNITGVETNIKKFEAVEVFAKNIREPTLDDVISTNNESVGTNDYASKNAPFYKVDLFRSSFVTGSMSKTYKSNNASSIPIPQLPINVKLSCSVHLTNADQPTPSYPDQKIISSEAFSDGSKFTIKTEQPLVRINEINGFDERDNFILTAYKVNNDNNTLTYKRLKFPTTRKKILNNILLEDSTVEFDFDNPFKGEKISGVDNINYYLDFVFDKDIPNEKICSTIGSLKIRNIYLDEIIECPEYDDTDGMSIYATRVRPEDLDEECD